MTHSFNQRRKRQLQAEMLEHRQLLAVTSMAFMPSELSAAAGSFAVGSEDLEGERGTSDQRTFEIEKSVERIDQARPLPLERPSDNTLMYHPAAGGVIDEAAAADPVGKVAKAGAAAEQKVARRGDAEEIVALRAGDVNRDYFFDEADLIQMFQAGKYETGQPAKWVDGDFAGGPNHASDGVFDSADLVYAFQTELYTVGSYNKTVAATPVHTRSAIADGGRADFVLTYYAVDGTIKIEGSETILSTFHLHSNSGIFVGPASNQSGVYDVASATSLFHLATQGTASLAYPQIAEQMLTRERLLADLTVDGSRLEGGPLGNVVLNYVSSMAGDISGDHLLDVDDMDLLCRQISRQDDVPGSDLNNDGRLDVSDMVTLIEEVFGTRRGDANLDGVVDSSDLVLAFQSGSYEDGVQGNSSWQSGDWDCNGEFESSDFVQAFQGGYLANAEARVAAASPNAFAAALDALESQDDFEVPQAETQNGRPVVDRILAGAVNIKGSRLLRF